MQDENPYCKLTVPISLQFVVTDCSFNFKWQLLIYKKKKKKVECLKIRNMFIWEL